MKNFIKFSFLTAIVSIAMFSCELFETKYTVKFDSKGGTPTPQEQTVKEGGKVSKPTDPTRENFDFAGWAKADNETSALWNFETETVSEEMTLFARWATKRHQVTFDSDGGTAVTAQNVVHGSVAPKPEDPTRSGFEFDGWFSGETEWNFATAIIAPITLTAKWTALHVVSFDSDGGNAVPTQTIRNGNSVTKPEDPTRDGYEFDGWFDGDAKWNFATAITAPITLKAKWTKLHVVTFDSDGGSVVPAQNIRDGNTVTKPADPTRAIASGLYLGTLTDELNFTFEGWYNGENLWDFDNDAITAPITLKAVWSLAGSVTRIEAVLSNDVAGAFAYVNANSFSGEEYTLLIGASNVTVTVAQTLNAANAKLTIIGIETERIITSTAYQMFIINGNNATSLTLGRNITIKASAVHAYEAQKSLSILRGSLTMLDGSKITETRSGAIYVSGLNAIFKMEGGDITGNSPSLTGISGGVYVTSGGTFDMSGGSITGNTFNGNAEDLFINYNGTFHLSGNARIGTLTLTAAYATTRPSVSIGGIYSGRINVLHLSGANIGGESINSVPAWWTNTPLIINGTASVISMFNNALGDFVYNQLYWLTTALISKTHEINASGFLVLKED